MAIFRTKFGGLDGFNSVDRPFTRLCSCKAATDTGTVGAKILFGSDFEAMWLLVGLAGGTAGAAGVIFGDGNGGGPLRTKVELTEVETVTGNGGGCALGGRTCVIRGGE